MRRGTTRTGIVSVDLSSVEHISAAQKPRTTWHGREWAYRADNWRIRPGNDELKPAWNDKSPTFSSPSRMAGVTWLICCPRPFSACTCTATHCPTKKSLEAISTEQPSSFVWSSYKASPNEEVVSANVSDLACFDDAAACDGQSANGNTGPRDGLDGVACVPVRHGGIRQIAGVHSSHYRWLRVMMLVQSTDEQSDGQEASQRMVRAYKTPLSFDRRDSQPNEGRSICRTGGNGRPGRKVC